MSLVLGAASAGCTGGIVGPAAQDEDEATPDAGAEEEAELLSCAPASGSRLKRVLHRYEDGSEVFVGHHDGELDAPCEFRAASDGTTRCMPRDPDVAPWSTLRHRDPNCTQRLAQVTASSAPAGAPRYTAFYAPSSTRCEPVVWGARLGATLLLAPQDTVYAIEDGVCVPRNAGTSRYYEITGLLEPSEMVGGTESWVGGERMEMVQIDGDDGSRACNSGTLRDRAMDMMSCTSLYAGADDIRCLPAGSATASSAYADAACSAGVTVGVSYDSCFPDRRYAIESRSFDECPDTSIARVYRIADEMSAATYSEVGEQCIAMGASATVYEVEEEVPTSTFARLVRTWQPMGERLERGDLASDDGLRFHRTMIRDADFGAACAFDVAGDGQTRCVPRPSDNDPLLAVVTRYTDAACTAPLTVATRPFDTCFEETPAFAAGEVDGKKQVYAVGAAIGTPLYEAVAGTLCNPAEAGAQHFALGEAVAPATFLAGEKVVEE